MTFQAYIDNIKEKTGKGPSEFKQLARFFSHRLSAMLGAWTSGFTGPEPGPPRISVRRR